MQIRHKEAQQNKVCINNTTEIVISYYCWEIESKMSALDENKKILNFLVVKINRTSGTDPRELV